MRSEFLQRQVLWIPTCLRGCTLAVNGCLLQAPRFNGAIPKRQCPDISVPIQTDLETIHATKHHLSIVIDISTKRIPQTFMETSMRITSKVSDKCTAAKEIHIEMILTKRE